MRLGREREGERKRWERERRGRTREREGERMQLTQGGGEVREKPAFRKHESWQKIYSVNSNILFVSTN